MEKGHSPVQSIDRLFDIVEALSNAPRGMALSDLSAAVGLHTSTTHRLLAALVARGYVQKDIESGKYRLTMRLFEVGSRAVGGMNIVSLARPYLEHLAATTHEAIHLVVRDGDEVVYLYKENMGDSTVRMASFVGLRNPMYCTAVGKSILSCLPEAEVTAIWLWTALRRARRWPRRPRRTTWCWRYVSRSIAAAGARARKWRTLRRWCSSWSHARI